jgi:hypothetical protein
VRSTYNLDQKPNAQQQLSLQHLQFEKAVHTALQGFAPCGYSQLMRTRTVPDHRYTSVLDIIHEYTANEIDSNGAQHLLTMQAIEDFTVSGNIEK